MEARNDLQIPEETCCARTRVRSEEEYKDLITRLNREGAAHRAAVFL